MAGKTLRLTISLADARVVLKCLDAGIKSPELAEDRVRLEEIRGYLKIVARYGLLSDSRKDGAWSIIHAEENP